MRVLFLLVPALVACPAPEDLPPTAPVVEIRPPDPLATEWFDVFLVQPALDPEGSEVEHVVRWTADGEAVAELDDQISVFPQLTSAGEVWAVSIHGVDPEGNAGPAARDEVTISGSPPSISGVALLPRGPTIAHTLWAEPRDWTDEDGDLPRYRFDWFVDDALVSSEDELPPSMFAVGATVMVRATPLDDLTEGSPVDSQPAVIREADACFALGFDGDDHVVFDGFLQNLRGDFTIEAWIAPAGAGVRVIASTRGPDDGGWSVYLDAADHVAIDAGGSTTASDAPVPRDGAVHHVAVGRRDAEGTVRFWIDGAAAGVAELPAAGENGVLHVGRFADAEAGFFEGVIDDLRLAALPRYNNTFEPDGYWVADGFTTGLWHFPEGAGVTSVDATGGGRTAQLHGPTWVDDPTACTR